MKKCAHCQQIKELKDFRKKLSQKDGFDYNCRKCSCQQSKESKYRVRYGITLQEKELKLEEQKGLCALCGEKITSRVCVDHNHRTDQVRGILCNSCNIGLGAFYDSVEKLNMAIQYLKRWKGI
jgi:hypothetical protein